MQGNVARRAVGHDDTASQPGMGQEERSTFCQHRSAQVKCWICVSIITPMWFGGWLMLCRKMLLQDPSCSPLCPHLTRGACGDIGGSCRHCRGDRLRPGCAEGGCPKVTAACLT